MARIIDLTAHSAVYATRLLVESGHEVVRVEPPGGDALRRLEPFLGDAPDLERGAYHLFLNAGKQSMTLDLENAAGREIFLSLASAADAVVGQTPFPVSREALTQANPRLVTVEVEDDATPELCAYARAGLLAITGHPGHRPAVLGGHIVYGGAGLYVALAAAVALHQAQRIGRGSTVRVSLRQCLETFVEFAMVTYTFEDRITERRGYRGSGTAVSGAFPCKDGYWMISVPHSPKGWRAFMEWVNDPVLMADESLEHEANRAANRDMILDPPRHLVPANSPNRRSWKRPNGGISQPRLWPPPLTCHPTPNSRRGASSRKSTTPPSARGNGIHAGPLASSPVDRWARPPHSGSTTPKSWRNWATLKMTVAACWRMAPSEGIPAWTVRC